MVVAIISLLVSILLPSLTKAKELARQTACAVNLKNLGLTALMFTEEHDGKYCIPDGQIHINPNLWDECWIRFSQGAPATTEGTNQVRSAAGVLTCPSDDNTAPPGESQRSYAINPYIINYNGDYQSPPAPYCSITVSNIPKPDDTTLLSEFHYNWNVFANSYLFTMAYAPSGGAYGGPYHATGANLLFASGRVEWVDAIDEPNAYYLRYILYK